MDGVGPVFYCDVPGIFGLMDPMPGAIDAVHRLAKKYDVYILSTAPWKNPSAWSDKVVWVTRYLDDVLHKRIILSHQKDLLKGDYLIDDRPKHGAATFEGKWIPFGDTISKFLNHHPSVSTAS